MHPNACAQGIIIEVPLKSQGQRKNDKENCYAEAEKNT